GGRGGERGGGGSDPVREFGGGREGAGALAREHAGVFEEKVADGEVEEAVAVDVPHRHGNGLISGGEVAGGLEGAVAVAQQHAHVVAANARVGDGEVEEAVAVDVPHRHGKQAPTGGEVHRL